LTTPTRRHPTNTCSADQRLKDLQNVAQLGGRVTSRLKRSVEAPELLAKIDSVDESDNSK
jgi:hypothetical protein